MRMILEMRYRRTGQFIYTKEICSIFQADNVEHTNKEILENTVEFKYSLRLARKWRAFEDLKCIDRNMHSIDHIELYTED
ncbi:conserved hypothetical protein [Vibrio crassostreae]|nr:conserved hypothetical protein [Vibrio crassostreae]CAK3510931.1 conserved hypothetical protein [Vibrio crassostreae]